MSEKLTHKEYNAILAGARVYARKAHASVRIYNKRFVLEGKSGTHSLDIMATDLSRLNAHWTTFCAHAINQRPQ